MFSIGFTEEPLIAAEPGEQGKVGLLTLGTWEERFVAHFVEWSKEEYARHWRDALTRALEAKPSALITDMWLPAHSSHLTWWPMWRIGKKLVFQNHLLLFYQHGLDDSTVQVESLYGLIGERRTHGEDGSPISEWSVSLSEVEEFLRCGEPR